MYDRRRQARKEWQEGRKKMAGIKAGMWCDINGKEMRASGSKKEMQGTKMAERGRPSLAWFLLTDVMLEMITSLYFCIYPRLLLNAHSHQKGSQCTSSQNRWFGGLVMEWIMQRLVLLEGKLHWLCFSLATVDLYKIGWCNRASFILAPLLLLLPQCQQFQDN